MEKDGQQGSLPSPSGSLSLKPTYLCFSDVMDVVFGASVASDWLDNKWTACVHVVSVFVTRRYQSCRQPCQRSITAVFQP